MDKAAASTLDTRETILAAGKAMAQAHGYNGLSFREIAKAVGVKSASIHYHFPTKGDLGAALAKRYTDDASAAFEGLLASGEDDKTCFRRYLGVFRAALENDNRMCLYGIMAAERDDLPPEVGVEVARFTEVNVAWIVSLLARTRPGSRKSTLERQALAMFAAIEGAQLIAREKRDLATFDRIIEAYRASGLLP